MACPARSSGYGKQQGRTGNSGSRRSCITCTTSSACARRTSLSSETPRAGIDGETWRHYGENLEGNLLDLSERLKRGAYRARPVRRAYIPKADGRLRPLGVPTLEDKIVQRAVVEVMNAIYEEDFLGFSYGFRPGRSPHQALDALSVGIMTKKVNWVLDADIRDFLDASSHYPPCVDRRFEEARKRVRYAYSQALATSEAHVDGVEFAALYTLQHRLAGHAENLRRLEHRQVAGGRLLHEARAQLVGDADLPRRAGRELLGGDEAIVDPAMHRRRGDAEKLGGLLHGHQFADVGVRALEASDAPMRAQAADAVRREAHPCGGGAPLPIEDPGDHCVGIEHGEAANEVNGILVGAVRWLNASSERIAVRSKSVSTRGRCFSRLASSDSATRRS